MSDWAVEFEQHPVHTTIQNLGERLESSELVTQDQNEDDLVSRIRIGLTHIEAVIANALAGITKVGVLSNVNTSLTEILNQLNQYISTKNVGHLNNTTNSLDQAINHSRNIPLAFSGGGKVKTYTSYLSALKNQSKSSISQIRENALRTLETQKQIGSEFDTQKNRLASFEELLRNQDTRIDALATKFQSEYDSTKKDFDQKSELLGDSINLSFDELKKFLKDSFEAEKLDFTKEAREKIDELETKNEQASRLVEAIGNTGITGNYQKRAKTEGESADEWRKYSVVFWLMLILTMSGTLIANLFDDSDWTIFLFRMLTGLFFALPATYAAKESSKHRKLEGFYRQRELELASLEPFLELMDEETKNKIREELANSYFGQEPRFLEEPSKSKGVPIPSNIIEKLIQAIVKE